MLFGLSRRRRGGLGKRKNKSRKNKSQKKTTKTIKTRK